VKARKDDTQGRHSLVIATTLYNLFTEEAAHAAHSLVASSFSGTCGTTETDSTPFISSVLLPVSTLLFESVSLSLGDLVGLPLPVRGLFLPTLGTALPLVPAA